jgi:peptidoglycan-associated lipoprotein
MKRELVRWTVAAAAVAASACGPTYPNCDDDGQCHEGEFCVNGRCQDCRTSADCPRGQECREHACAPIEGWCDTSAQCEGDEDCVGNRCRPRTSASAEGETAPGPCELRPAYFGFDESALDDAARTALSDDARCISERAIEEVELVGMCDPRGTEEYNIALGERRARTARDHLQRLGVARNRMRVRSVGEEQARGADEHGWSRDRRADVRAR